MHKKPEKSKPKGLLKLFWYYLKEDEGPVGWILNIIVAFIVIKYLFIPGLGLVLNTEYPLVAIVSGSMEHHGRFATWWESSCQMPTGSAIQQKEIYLSYGISKDDLSAFPFRNGLNTGDLMILQGPTELMIGDVIVFNAGTKVDPIIHRIVSIKEVDSHKIYKTKGDDNCGSSGFEENIEPRQIVGKGWVRIPLLGYVKLYFEKALLFFGLDSAIALFR